MKDSARALLLMSLVLSVPVRAWAAEVSGSLGYAYRSLSGPGDVDATSNQLLGTLRGSTYVWQPWFATAEAGLTLAQDSSDVDTGTSSASSTSTVTSGDLLLNVLAQSRTPFRLVFQMTDSRVDDATVQNPLVTLSGEEYKTTNFDLTQAYITEEGNRVQAHYANRTWESDISGTYDDELIGLDADWKQEDYRVLAKANMQTTDQSKTDRHAENLILDLDHFYFPTEDLRFDSKLSHYNYDSTFEGGTSIIGTSNMKVSQASSFAFWRPMENQWTVTGGARYFTLDGEGTTQSSEQSNLSANAGAFYQYSKNLRFDGSIATSVADVNGASEKTFRERVGVLFQSDLKDFGKYTYQWYANGSQEYRVDPFEDFVSLSAGLGHDLERTWVTGDTSMLRLSASQVFNELLQGGDGETEHRLDHTLSLGWNKSEERALSLVALTLSDARNFGDVSDEQQLVNFQASRRQDISRRSSLTGNLTLQSVRQDFSGGANDGTVTTTTGQIGYDHTRLFGVPKLNFRSDLRVSSASTSEGVDRNEWENRLTYGIGMLDTSLSVRMMDNDGDSSTLVYFRAMRRF